MIRLLHIENIAVIEKADIEFEPGLNVLTGETGAGKSIVIDAISAVTGGRTSREIIRTGENYASVTAVFSEPENSFWFVENGVEQDDSGELFIMRRISSDGKNSCRVNGTPVSTAQLRELCALLLDIHGQNDGRKLLDEGAHLRYLDEFGGHADVLNEYRESYRSLEAKKTIIDKLTLSESEKDHHIETLKYQIEELERAGLHRGEYEELTSKRDLLHNASKLTEAVESAHRALYGGDGGEGVGYSDGAVALIGRAQEEIERASRYADSLRGTGERLQDLRYTAQDIADELRDIRGQLDFKPGVLEELEVRLDILRRIIRKYGDVEDALNYLEQCKNELADIEDSSDRLSKLENEMKECLQQTTLLAAMLSEARKNAATVLQKQVSDELQQLNMPGVSFLVEFDDIPSENNINSNGQDEVRFLISANAGETPGRISRIASGGELSRIMLALKNVLGGDQDRGTSVFDEIDAGVSGIAAQRVAEKLIRLARDRQVLCVTHLPQIAVMADAHFEIHKSVESGRTFTHIMQLDFEGRKKEIARLSGGENITETTLKSAGEQLSAAEIFRSELGIVH